MYISKQNSLTYTCIDTHSALILLSPDFFNNIVRFIHILLEINNFQCYCSHIVYFSIVQVSATILWVRKDKPTNTLVFLSFLVFPWYLNSGMQSIWKQSTNRGINRGAGYHSQHWLVRWRWCTGAHRNHLNSSSEVQEQLWCHRKPQSSSLWFVREGWGVVGSKKVISREETCSGSLSKELSW